MSDKKDNNDKRDSEKRRGHAQRTLEFQKIEKNSGQFRRPRPRRRPSEVTAEFGSVSPRRVKKKTDLSSIKKSFDSGITLLSSTPS